MTARSTASSLATTLRSLLLAERFFLEWLSAGLVLGINYGASSRAPVTLRDAATQRLRDGQLVFNPELLLGATQADRSTISGSLLFGLSFGLPAALVVLTNAAQHPGAGGRLGAAALARGTRDVHHLMLAVLQAYALASCWKIWLNVGVGRLRPDWHARVATGDAGLIAEGRLSYPSGHAAYSHTSGAVCFCWLCGRLGVFGACAESPRVPLFLRLLLALSPVGLATYIGTTRITDYVHHVSDVNAGSFIGLACGVLCYLLHYNVDGARPKIRAPAGRAGGEGEAGAEEDKAVDGA
jgi:membrane-associated phospholipid phosphatase